MNILHDSTQPVPTAADRDLDLRFDTFMNERLARSPELTTSLGLDTGALADAKGRLDERSLEALADDRLTTIDRRRQLAHVDRADLTPRHAIFFDIADSTLALEQAEDEAYGAISARPYVVTQMDGAYGYIPDFLDGHHTIATADDADAYLARLQAFARVLDQESERIHADAARGVVPPDFVLAQTIRQLGALARTPTESCVLVTSLKRRAVEQGLDANYAARAAVLYEGRIVPALARQLGALAMLMPQATHESGLWKLKDGAALYSATLKMMTTTDKSPEEIHAIGLETVRDLTARTDELMRAQGLTQGSVSNRFSALFNDPRYRYPNTDAGKEALLDVLNGQVSHVKTLLPRWFGALPKADVAVKRVPPYIEAGASGGYYQAPALDGSRPGFYYINLRDTAEQPGWLLPTLTYHEALPGHHLQLALLQEMPDVPLLLRTRWQTAYGEGWGLYAEQLADEMGLYDSDPFGRIGYLHDALLRAARLVVDTGLHAMRWSRERAIAYMVDVLGGPENRVTTEIERYCVMPGQACAYMIGKMTWVELRERARRELGDRFDIRAFHDAGLLSGAMPLAVLERVVEGWVAGMAKT